MPFLRALNSASMSCRAAWSCSRNTDHDLPRGCRNASMCMCMGRRDTTGKSPRAHKDGRAVAPRGVGVLKHHAQHDPVPASHHLGPSVPSPALGRSRCRLRGGAFPPVHLAVDAAVQEPFIPGKPQPRRQGAHGLLGVLVKIFEADRCTAGGIGSGQDAVALHEHGQLAVEHGVQGGTRIFVEVETSGPNPGLFPGSGRWRPILCPETSRGRVSYAPDGDCAVPSRCSGSRN